MGIDAKEKTARAHLLAQMLGSPFKKILTTVYPLRRQKATGK